MNGLVCRQVARWHRPDRGPEYICGRPAKHIVRPDRYRYGVLDPAGEPVCGHHARAYTKRALRPLR